MKRKHPVKFVYFDVGGVILRWRQLLHTIARNHNRKIEEVERAFAKFDPASCRGQISPQQLWEAMKKELVIVENEPTDFSQLAMQSFSPIFETHALLGQIIDQVSLGILTNVHHGFFDRAVKHGHIPQLPYKAVIQSCHIGFIKPEREIYKHAQKKAGVKAAHILLVDDYVENVAAAKRRGWQAIRFDTDNPQRSIQKIRSIIA